MRVCNSKNKDRELEKLSIGDLNACGCEACSEVAQEKRVEFLETYYEQTEREKLAQQKGREMAKQFKTAIQQEEKATEDKALEVFHNELNRDGIDLNKVHGLRTIVQKMNFDMAPRRNAPYVNSGRYRGQELRPETMDFLSWMRTGQVSPEHLDWAGDATPGSNVVPEELHNRIIELRNQGSVMRQSGAQTFQMSSDTMLVPVETSIGSAAIQQKQGTKVTGEDPTNEQIKLEPLSWFHEIVVSTQMLRDSAVNLADYFARVFGRSMVVLENQMFFAGSGTNEPLGLGDSGVGIANVGADESNPQQTILDLFYGLEPQYRNNAVWYFHGTVLSKIASTLGDKWFQTFADGQPTRLLGRPVYETNEIPNNAGTGETRDIFFGDPSYYFIGEADRLFVSRSDHAYWSTNQVAFKAEQRVDGKVGSTVPFRRAEWVVDDGGAA